MLNNEIVEDVLKSLGVPNNLFEEVKKTMAPKVIKKGESFVERNRYEQKLGIVISGILESKFLHQNGLEYTANYYYPEGTRLVSDYMSFIHNRKAEETITAIEDSLVMVLDKEIFNDLLDKHQALREVATNLLNNTFLLSIKRIRYFQVYSNEERVEHFKDKHPLIYEKAEKQSVASFLGMHRNTLAKYE